MSVMLSPTAAVEEAGLFKGRPTNAAVDFAHFLPKETEQPAADRQADRKARPDRFVVVENCNGAFPRKRNGRMAETLLRVSMFAAAAVVTDFAYLLAAACRRARGCV